MILALIYNKFDKFRRSRLTFQNQETNKRQNN